MRGFSRVMIVGLLVFGGVAAAALLVLSHAQKVSNRSKSEDNIKSLISVRFDSGRFTPEDYPRLSGRNYILSCVASGQVKAGGPMTLWLLWPPQLDEQFHKIDPRAYEQVSWESLKTRRFPNLTGYAGPRSAGQDLTISLHDGNLGTPLIADLTDPDGIIVGFSNMAVRFMTWEDLEMDPPDGPVTVGPKAKNPILQMLSNE